MKLDKDTYGTVLLVYLVCAVAIFLLLRFVSPWWIKWPLTLALLANLFPYGARPGSDRR